MTVNQPVPVTDNIDASVPRRSPLWTTGKVIQFLREQLSQPEFKTFGYDLDPAKTRLYILSAYDSLPDKEDGYMSIVVNHGALVSSRDFAANDSSDNNAHILAKSARESNIRCTTDLYLECNGTSAADANRLGFAVWTIFELGYRILRQELTLHDVSPVVLQPPTPYPGDQTGFKTRVDLRITWEQRYTLIRREPTLASAQIDNEATGGTITTVPLIGA